MAAEQQKEAMEGYVEDLGSSLADFYGLINTQFNLSMELQNRLPYAKMLSDMSGVCMGINCFYSSLRAEFDYMAAVPFKGPPINPFNMLRDPQLILEALNASHSDEMEEEHAELLRLYHQTYGDNTHLRELKVQLTAFNEGVQSALQHIESLEKPAKYKEKKQFGIIHSARLTAQHADAGHLERLLHTLKTGEGLD